jgi:hypothetical protein
MYRYAPGINGDAEKARFAALMQARYKVYG